MADFGALISSTYVKTKLILSLPIADPFLLSKKIQLIDYEVLTDVNGFRIIGFGRFAGLVGAYNGFRALGLRNRFFVLKPAHECSDLEEMLGQLDKIELAPVKIAVTGDGRVAGGVLEILNYLKIMRVTPENYLNWQNPDYPDFTQLLPRNYVKRKDGTSFDLMHFFNHPGMYENAFLKAFQ